MKMASEHVLVPKHKYLRMISSMNEQRTVPNDDDDDAKLNGAGTDSEPREVSGGSEPEQNDNTSSSDKEIMTGEGIGVISHTEMPHDTSTKHDHDKSLSRAKDDLKSEQSTSDNVMMMPPGERVEKTLNHVELQAKTPLTHSKNKTKRRESMNAFTSSKYGDIKKKWITI